MSDLVVLSEKIERVLMHGDLSTLNDKEKVEYHNNVCHSLGLNPLTKPFAYIELNGKLQLYARKDATDQLRMLYKISIQVTDRRFDKELEMIVVSAKATTPDGREDEAIAYLSIYASSRAKGRYKMQGEELANAFMKCETKAKRRVTLSICGLGMLDESEIESVRNVSPEAKPDNPALPKNEAPTKPDESTIKKLREAYSNLAVDEQMLKTLIKKDLSKMTFEDLTLLRQTYNDIKQGNKDLNEVFG